MIGTLDFHTTTRTFVSMFSVLVIAVVAGGCRSSRQAPLNEGFFEPLKSVDRSATSRPTKVVEGRKSSSLDQMTDSLLSRQKEHERRIGDLAGQMQLLETSRNGDTVVSSRRAIPPPVGGPQPAAEPVPGKYKEVQRMYEAGQYKAAIEGFRALLQSGVPKDVEDKCHYMLGMSYFKLRQFDLAAASMKTVTNLKGSGLRADAYYVLGQTYKQLGANRQAKSMFEAVLRVSPKPALADSARNELKALAAKK
jgi:TolA-binding protein